jgi:hypothetical protein
MEWQDDPEWDERAQSKEGCAPGGPEGHGLPRDWVACVVCACGDWNDTRRPVYLTGAKCSFPAWTEVNELLRAHVYHQRWKFIPKQELYASAVVVCPPPEAREEHANRVRKDADRVTQTRLGVVTVDDKATVTLQPGEILPDQPDDIRTSEQGDGTLWLLHKRRVTPAAAKGDEAAWMCLECSNALCRSKPTLPDGALANDIWIGRNHPVMRDTQQGTKMVMPIARACPQKGPQKKTHAHNGEERPIVRRWDENLCERGRPSRCAGPGTVGALRQRHRLSTIGRPRVP